MLTTLQKPGSDLGAPMPMNNLSGKRATISGTRLSPPAKRPKRDVQPAAHTSLQFAPPPDSPADFPSSPRSRKRSHDSISLTETIPTPSQHSNPGAVSQNIDEYRNVEKQARSRPTKRRRHKRPDKQGESSSGMNREDSIAQESIEVDDSDDDSRSPKERRPEQHPAPTTAPHGELKLRDSKDVSRYFPKRPVIQAFKDMIDDSEKRLRDKDHSPDELALAADDIREKQPVKRRGPHSPSISKRGNIRPTDFKRKEPGAANGKAAAEERRRAGQCIGHGLRVLHAVTGHSEYREHDASETGQLFLSLQEISTILLPSDKEGNVKREGYEFLTINLKKVQSGVMATAPTCNLVQLKFHHMKPSEGIGPIIIIRFSSRHDAESLRGWVQMKRKEGPPPNFHFCLAEKLENDFKDLIERVPRHVSKETAHPKIPEDLALISHNRTHHQGAPPHAPHQEAGSARLQVSKPKLRDKMAATCESQSIRDGTSRMEQRTAVQPEEKRPRTTRATFLLADSPEPEPVVLEPTWTSLNPDWGKNWRTSLVFPNKGKSRATVDKDDIPRLDAGQFLNDNLVIFYLRYLQDRLEKERPDLASRIYFLNTFFYEKLKPTKTGHGINYDSVRAWTSKVDLFSKDFVIVPINEYAHWYVAIIYNAPKLIPSSASSEAAGTAEGQPTGNTITIADDADGASNGERPSLHHGAREVSLGSGSVKTGTLNDVTRHLSRMSIKNHEDPASETKWTTDSSAENAGSGSKPVEHTNTIHVVPDSDDTRGEEEHTSLPGSSQDSKKPGKRQSAGARKRNLDQPKIITLDSLGSTHSPTCSYLKKYLVAELKDKKGIEIDPPGALGMTAKGVPEQTNHCDCGLFVLGYVQEFLKDPDGFVRSLLQHDCDIPWNLDPSKLRNDMRQLIFSLQREHQEEEEEMAKRRGVSKKKRQAESVDQPGQLNASLQVTLQDRPMSSPAKVADSSGKSSAAQYTVVQVPSTKGTKQSLRLDENANGPTAKAQSSGSDKPEKQQERPRVPKRNVLSEGAATGISVDSKPPNSEAKEEKQAEDAEGHSHMPGSFPASPLKTNGNATRARSVSLGAESTDPIHENFLTPLKSSSAASSRGGTPANPMLVDEEDGEARDAQEDTPKKRDESQNTTSVASSQQSAQQSAQQSTRGWSFKSWSFRGLSGPPKAKEKSPVEKSPVRSPPSAIPQQNGEMHSARLVQDAKRESVIHLSD
ncbi:hypothetical protein F4780DRAFT_598648 [Xylariomycetidae sp. FL0641]|nr:hypothetical protein F4780DRAFT_598648 [Xylariomycetidae sp. FL0641]